MAATVKFGLSMRICWPGVVGPSGQAEASTKSVGHFSRRTRLAALFTEQLSKAKEAMAWAGAGRTRRKSAARHPKAWSAWGPRA